MIVKSTGVARAALAYRLEHWGLGGNHKPKYSTCANPHAGEELELVTGDYARTFRNLTLAHTRNGLLVVCGAPLRARITSRGSRCPAKPSSKCADPFAPSEGPLVVIGALRKLVGKSGELREIQYDTEKLGDGPSSYVHEFLRPFPTLARTRRGHLVICGGGYRFTLRGIVG